MLISAFRHGQVGSHPLAIGTVCSVACIHVSQTCPCQPLPVYSMWTQNWLISSRLSPTLSHARRQRFRQYSRSQWAWKVVLLVVSVKMELTMGSSGSAEYGDHPKRFFFFANINGDLGLGIFFFAITGTLPRWGLDKSIPMHWEFNSRWNFWVKKVVHELTGERTHAVDVQTSVWWMAIFGCEIGRQGWLAEPYQKKWGAFFAMAYEQCIEGFKLKWWQLTSFHRGAVRDTLHSPHPLSTTFKSRWRPPATRLAIELCASAPLNMFMYERYGTPMLTN